MKEIFLVGTSFRNASACERKHLAFSNEQSQQLHATIAQQIPDAEFCMVSTCNRAEFLLIAPESPGTLAALITAISSCCPRFDELLNAGKIVYKKGQDAFEHLLRVTCGLESVVLGDTQIVQQVRQALQLARDTGSSGAYLEQAFGRALSLGSRVRSETDISSGSPGVAAAICDTIAEWQSVFDKCSDRIVLIGAGTINRGVARTLASRGHRRVTIVNRSISAANTLAIECSAYARPWAELTAAVADAGVVVVATGARQPVVTVEMLEAAQKTREFQGRQLVLDAGMPPNVEPVSLDNVTVVGIDHLRQFQDRHLDRRRAAIPQVERYIQQELALWNCWLAQRPLEKVLKSLYLDLATVPSRLTQRISNPALGTVDELHYAIHRELKQLLHPHVIDLRRLVVTNCGKSENSIAGANDR